MLARGLYWSGITSVLHNLPPKNSLLVLNYHRIGKSADDLFDPGVFSATSDELNEQLIYLKRNASLVTLAEAKAFCQGKLKDRAPQCRVLLTFDDGYLDNYQIAFPVLRSHDLQGVFFLATGLVGTCTVPWWDHIAFSIKTARQRQFTLSYPSNLDVDLTANGVEKSLDDVLRLYKSPLNKDADRFIRELMQEARSEALPGTLRRFLNWEEAREMIAGGMAIGSHTHSHPVLGQLELEEQRKELALSRARLIENLGVDIDALAYPVGDSNSYSAQTQQIANETGYQVAFSFHGGSNLAGAIAPFDVKRVGVGYQSRIRFRVQAEIYRSTGRYLP